MTIRGQVASRPYLIYCENGRPDQTNKRDPEKLPGLTRHNERPGEVGEPFSSSRLLHLFKRDSSASLGQFRKSLRLEHARTILEGSFLNVKEVMSQVGFSDESHFTREFKRNFGHTPGHYRSHLRRHSGG